MVWDFPAAHVFDVLYVDTRIFALFISDGVSAGWRLVCLCSSTAHHLFEYII